MLMPKQTLDMTPIGAVFHVTKTAQQTNGQSLEMEWELLPTSGGTPVHIHPSAKETYKVIEGQLEINVDGRWKLLQKGEELTVPERIPHTFRNPSNSLTRVYNIHSPALRFDEYFEGLYNIVAKLSAGGKVKLKMNINTATHLSMLMKKYSEEIVSVNPPDFIVSLLNTVGKIRGIKI
jgi:mannose-6-phosphate isomerase-like protein (cupin superfamily)